MTNKEVVEKFIRGQAAHSSTGNLASTGKRLFSYNTCIAEFHDERNLVVNFSRYSATTSGKHQNPLKAVIHKYGLEGNVTVVVDDLPFGVRTIVGLKAIPLNQWKPSRR